MSCEECERTQHQLCQPAPEPTFPSTGAIHCKHNNTAHVNNLVQVSHHSTGRAQHVQPPLRRPLQLPMATSHGLAARWFMHAADMCPYCLGGLLSALGTNFAIVAAHSQWSRQQPTQEPKWSTVSCALILVMAPASHQASSMAHQACSAASSPHLQRSLMNEVVRELNSTVVVEEVQVKLL